MSRDTIRLPHDAYRLLQTLRAAGHSAYVVGGCVRDSLLGRLPGDWDICTSARPDEMKALFCSQRLILTGEKHGTVAVILHGKPYEMTTYRLDGSYRDHRHPDNVQFVDDLAADLARRDFTINAMAYAPGEGVIDLYGGRSDLAARVVRCVGTPADRFAEDALRILRALRFSAKLGFALDPATAAAAVAGSECQQQDKGHKNARYFFHHFAPSRTKKAAATPSVSKCPALIHYLGLINNLTVTDSVFNTARKLFAYKW